MCGLCKEMNAFRGVEKLIVVNYDQKANISMIDAIS